MATTPEFAVLAHSFVAYPVGVSFVIELRVRRETGSSPLALDFHRTMQATYTDGELSPTFFRFGIELSDGTKLTNLDRHETPVVDEGPPLSPVLRQRGGGGGVDMEIRYWLWPLPDGRPMSLVCEWPVLNLSVSRIELDTAEIARAAELSRPCFESTG
jgi:hypothetical protein